MGKTKFDFSGQVAIITGASVGIGKGLAEAFAEAGAHAYIRSQKLRKTQKATEQARGTTGAQDG